MTGSPLRSATRVIAIGLGLVASLACRADADEAWLMRAELPATVEPLLAVIVDTSVATARSVEVDEPYDPLRDYGTPLPASGRCNATRAYWRRGAGPAPDCARQAGLALAPAGPATGLQCEAARTSLAGTGFFVAPRALQWRPESRDWAALNPTRADAVDCAADREASRAEPTVFYAGNYLNYLRAVKATVQRALSEVLHESLAAALAATAGLQVALVRVDPDGPAGGYVARAPVASVLAATDLLELAREAPAGTASLADTLEETAAWLRGDAVRFGTDPRADTAATDPLAPGRYRSPFDHACRPLSLAVVTAGEPTADCSANCLAERGHGLASEDQREDLAGRQSAPVAWFAPHTGAIPDATSPATDPLAFVNLVARAFQHDASVPGLPQLSAAAVLPFGDERESGVILGLTAPRHGSRWAGNLFRYGLRAPASPLLPPTLVDRDGESAIDPATGLPSPASRSLWSDAPDANLLEGGAAGRLPPPDAREIYTDVASDRLRDPGNRLAPGNERLDHAALGLASIDPESVDDVLSEFAALRALGDPGPGAPLIVDYPESGRQVVLAANHDGLLQAFDADSGVEIWAWMPKELLTRLPELLRDEFATTRTHGIDGPLVVHRHDPDGDGRIDPGAGEHLWLLFGLGRGGHRYYALDISSAEDPALMWSVDFPDAEQVESRAEPVVSRLAIENSGQSAGDWVVVLAGGNSLHVVDAMMGRSLWSAGTGLASLSSAPRALDLDGDGYLDRLYALDVTGGLWRVDVPGHARLIARLGTGAHRFHATPDASVIRIGGENRLAISAGSGWLERPRDDSLIDRVYTVFDHDGAQALTEPDLHDATAGNILPAGAAGWFVRLERHGAGEKVIGPTVTFAHALRFQTYQPLPADEAAPCGPPRAVIRLYTLDVRSGQAHASVRESGEDEITEIVGSGLPVALRFGFPDRWLEACDGCRPRPFGIIGTATFDTGYAGDPVRTSWRTLVPPPASP